MTRVIAINLSHKLAPFADVLYGCDADFWIANRGIPEFRGLKFTQDRNAVRRFGDIHHVEIVPKLDRFIFEPGKIADGGNSGFQAINLAIQFGATALLLVGLDMRLDRGKHWHGPHGRGASGAALNNPSDANVIDWRNIINKEAATLHAKGLSVYRESDESTLIAFPVLSLDDFLRQYGDHADRLPDL